MSLRDFEQAKFAIAEILRAVSHVAPSEDPARREHLHDLFIRLAEDRFNLVVVGRFNRGKTSVMNAILGDGRLPVGIVPLTSVITTVSYGTSERVVLRFQNSGLSSSIPIDALSQYATQTGNPGNVLGIKAAEVRLRAEILRRGFHFVDTPGLGSAIPENTLTTESFLPQADAFLLVTGYESPLTEEEMRVLRAAPSSARRVFILVNKQDTVSPEHREAVIGYVRGQLRKIFGEMSPPLFSISATDGLKAKLAQDPELLRASGIPAFEDALIGFLLADKSDQFLRQMCRRTSDLIGTMAPSAEASALTEKIHSLSSRIAHPEGEAADPAASSTTERAEAPSPQHLKPCEICARVNDVLWDFACKFQYEISVSGREQRLFAQSGGLCSFHTWQYQALTSPYGICTAYPGLLDRWAKQLRTIAASHGEKGARPKLQPRVVAPGHCALCEVREKAESEEVSRLAVRFSQQQAQTLKSLSAICLSHLGLLCEALEDRESVQSLIKRQAELLERVAEDMRRYGLKRDATRRSLETEEEATAAERALLLIAGHRNVIAARGDTTTASVPAGHLAPTAAQVPASRNINI